MARSPMVPSSLTPTPKDFSYLVGARVRASLRLRLRLRTRPRLRLRQA